MDSRMMMTRIMQAQVGDMFVVRNSGNMIPHAINYGEYKSE
jgi:carbonic anhydrase